MKDYISILLTWMFENFRLAKELMHWNALTQHAVDCNTVNSFKRCVTVWILEIRGIYKLLLLFPFWSRLPSRSRDLLS